MAVKQLWPTPPQFVDANGAPYSGAFLFFYAAGSSTKQNTFTDDTGNTACPNPITLNSSGYPAVSGTILSPWGTAGQTYKIGLAAPGSADPPASFIWTQDDVAPINDTTVTIDQWVSGPAPTYIGATSFSLVGDQTSTFQVGRRLKTTNSGGTVYSTISASAFGAVTTVTVVNDSGTLDAGLSAVSYGLLSKTSDSMPRGIFPTMANVSKAIYGLTYANNVADATNDLDISAGGCVDATGVDTITVAALTKQSDAVWAVGTNAGALDTGVVGNSDYYIWAIKRVDTQVTDILFSLSSTAPTMPANYTLKRLIGWFKRVGGTIVAFLTYETEGGGLEMNWTTPTLDVDSATLSTARLASAVKVPLNFSVISHIRVYLFDAGGANVVIQCPDETDAAPSVTATPLLTEAMAAGTGYASHMHIRTSATGTIAARASAAVDNYRVLTIGFRWARRN